MASNQDKLDGIIHTLTGGESRVKEAGPVYAAVTEAARDAAWIREAFTPGESGKRSAGSVVAQLARIEGQGAVIQNLVKALANVSGGESFDQAKLLAGIEKLLAEAVVKVDVTVEGAK